MYKLQTIIKKYVSNDKINNIIEYLNQNNITTLRFINENIIPLKFYNYNHIGGKDDSIFIDVNLKKKKYQARLYKYTESDNKDYKTINFIKIESILQNDKEFSNADHCAILIVDTDIKESNIQSINNYKDCIKCYDEKNNMYKIGDILIQIMIYISINKGMKKINLHDNSNYKCNKYDIPLINLRTMTHGLPFYSKYGFKPLNYNKNKENIYSKNELQILKDNYELFKKKPNMTKKELLSIIYYTKFDKKKDNEMLTYINNIVIPRLKQNNNFINEFLNNIVNDSKNQDKKYVFEACKLLKNIFMVIYNKCGYYDYIEKKFVLELDNNKIIQHFTNRIKLKL